LEHNAKKETTTCTLTKQNTSDQHSCFMLFQKVKSPNDKVKTRQHVFFNHARRN